MMILARALAYVRRVRPLVGKPRALPAAAARGLAAAPPCARGLATAPPSLVFYTKRAGAAAFTRVEGCPRRPTCRRSSTPTIAKLRLDAAPDSISLALTSEGSPPHDTTQTLEEAFAAGALAPRAKLLVSVNVAESPEKEGPISRALFRGRSSSLATPLATPLATAALATFMKDMAARDAETQHLLLAVIARTPQN